MDSSLQSPIPLVRADGEGYTYAGEWIDGFADRPELPPPVRVRLARLGERYAPQEALGGTARHARIPDGRARRDTPAVPELDGFQANAQEIARAFEDGVYAELTSERREASGSPTPACTPRSRRAFDIRSHSVSSTS